MAGDGTLVSEITSLQLRVGELKSNIEKLLNLMQQQQQQQLGSKKNSKSGSAGTNSNGGDWKPGNDGPDCAAILNMHNIILLNIRKLSAGIASKALVGEVNVVPSGITETSEQMAALARLTGGQFDRMNGETTPHMLRTKLLPELEESEAAKKAKLSADGNSHDLQRAAICLEHSAQAILQAFADARVTAKKRKGHEVENEPAAKRTKIHSNHDSNTLTAGENGNTMAANKNNPPVGATTENGNTKPGALMDLRPSQMEAEQLLLRAHVL